MVTSANASHQRVILVSFFLCNLPGEGHAIAIFSILAKNAALLRSFCYFIKDEPLKTC